MRNAFFVLLLTTLPFAAAAMPCRHSAPRNASVEASGLHRLSLQLGSADLQIHGVKGMHTIEVHGTACASDAASLKDLQVDSARHGETATVTARNRTHGGFHMSGNHYAYLKLQVRVPQSLAVRIESGSGDMRATRLASLDVDSGSGDLQADHIGGALTLQLGSGDVQARQIGSVDLRGTGSGDVRAEGVHGDVKVQRSGSGDLTFRNVGGAVGIRSSGSGDITLGHVAHDVDIGSTGSGDVTANDVGGNFSVHANGSGDIRYHAVKGSVSVPHRDDD